MTFSDKWLAHVLVGVLSSAMRNCWLDQYGLMLGRFSLINKTAQSFVALRCCLNGCGTLFCHLCLSEWNSSVSRGNLTYSSVNSGSSSRYPILSCQDSNMKENVSALPNLFFCLDFCPSLQVKILKKVSKRNIIKELKLLC